MIFNLFKRNSRDEFDYRTGGMFIKRIPNLHGEEGMRVRIEVGNKDFIPCPTVCTSAGRHSLPNTKLTLRTTSSSTAESTSKSTRFVTCRLHLSTSTERKKAKNLL